jgi:hypothetical protein
LVSRVIRHAAARLKVADRGPLAAVGIYQLKNNNLKTFFPLIETWHATCNMLDRGKYDFTLKPKPLQET